MRRARRRGRLNQIGRELDIAPTLLWAWARKLDGGGTGPMAVAEPAPGRAVVTRLRVTSRQAEAEAPPAFGPRRIIDLRTKTMQLSQTMFASALNVSPETVRSSKRGKNTPGGPALRLLEIAESEPGLILAKVSAKATTPNVVRETLRDGRWVRVNGKGSTRNAGAVKASKNSSADATKRVKVARKK